MFVAKRNGLLHPAHTDQNQTNQHVDLVGLVWILRSCHQTRLLCYTVFSSVYFKLVSCWLQLHIIYTLWFQSSPPAVTQAVAPPCINSSTTEVKMFGLGAHPPHTLITRAASCDLIPFWHKVWVCPGKKQKNADLIFTTSLIAKFEMSTPEGRQFTCFLSAKCYLRPNKNQKTLWNADKYICDASQLTNGLNKKKDSFSCAALAHALAYQWVISTTSVVSGPNQTAGNPWGLFLLKTNSTPQCIHLIKGRGEQLPSPQRKVRKQSL